MTKRKKRTPDQQVKGSLAETNSEAAQSHAEKDDAEHSAAKSQQEKEVAEQPMKPKQRKPLRFGEKMRNRPRKIKEWLGRNERSLTVWLPIVLTGLIIYITTLQWWAAERAIEVGNRAYVSVNKLTFIFRDPQIQELKPGDFAVAGINYINKGNSPALKMSVEASVEPLRNPISEPMETMPSSRLSQASAVLATDMEAYSIIKSDKPLDDAMLKALQDGRYSIYAWGTITYEDMFGKSHKTNFCFVHKPDGGVNFDVCAIHNTMD